MSNKYKDLVKGGWHPEKPGSTFKGQMKGLVGRGKSSSEEDSHTARPLNSLTDPGSFAPPPKRTGTGLAPPPPPSSTEKKDQRKVITAPSKYQDPRAAKVAPPEKVSHTQEQIDYAQQQGYWNGQEEDVEEQKPKGPYSVNTTGLQVNHLPAPPGRRDGADGRSTPLALPSSAAPPSYEAAVPSAGAPSLPPRLPPRTNSGGASPASPVLPGRTNSHNLINQGAVNRLGAAGVTVPGLGIGRPPPSNSSPSPPPPPRAPPGGNAQVNQLQNRFANMRTQASAPATETGGTTGGTTWAQKQAALKTASNFNKDPSTVSLSDAKSAAGVANNFRQRHGEQVAAGVSTANGLNQKYGVVNKVGGALGGPSQPQVNIAPEAAPTFTGLAGKKKPPPPPPKKKPNLGALSQPTASSTDGAPPPIPLGTRPAF